MLSMMIPGVASWCQTCAVSVTITTAICIGVVMGKQSLSPASFCVLHLGCIYQKQTFAIFAQVEADKCADIAKNVLEKQAICERDLAAAEPLVQ